MPNKPGDKSPNNNPISLDDFRKRREAEHKQAATYDYRTVDHLSYRSARIMLGNIGINESFALFVRRNRADPSRVLELEGTSIIAATVNLDDEEEISLSLKHWSIEEEKRLSEPIRRFMLVTHLAHHFLTTRDRLNFRTRLLEPVLIGGEEVHLEGERKKEVTTWRAAAGLGIIATAYKREEEQEEMRDYLADVLDWHHQHDMSFSNLPRFGDITLWELMNEDPPSDTSVSDRLIGIANPMAGLDLRKSIRETK
ncbi:MAG TPA: hypothetical protein VMR95_02425 [Candidatus Binatia bacterium]|nr:hypothetical protein [Candidatus Binatia bacterium]